MNNVFQLIDKKTGEVVAEYIGKENAKFFNRELFDGKYKVVASPNNYTNPFKMDKL